MPKLIAHLRPVTLFDIEGNETPSKRRLADAGERLMGTHGIDTPSLQEIAAAAGQAKKFAVQYHVGGRDGLIDAIFAIRKRHIVVRRQECIRLAEERGLMHDLDSLLEAVFLPMSEQVDANGHHSDATCRLHARAALCADADDWQCQRREGSVRVSRTGRPDALPSR